MNPLFAMTDGYEINEDYSLDSKEYRDLLLKNNIINNKHINTSMFGQPRTDNIIVDPETEYSLNNLGYRDIDWIGKAEILAVGCSNTWGFGVPVDERWTNILGKKINKEIRNLSFPGGSINDLVAKSFEHFKIFGNPEIMLCLFPDPFRLRLPVKKNLIKNFLLTKNTSDNKNIISDPDLFFANIHINENQKLNSQRMKYIKRPYTYQEILPLELLLFFSMQSIHLLEQYCNSNGIKLIWATWHRNTFNALSNDKENIFSNIVFNEDLLIDHHLDYEGKLKDNEYDKDCHKEYENYFKKYFNIGGDIQDGLENAHPGVHKHIHIAEAFYKEINDNLRN